jgi:hypothetical protein
MTKTTSALARACALALFLTVLGSASGSTIADEQVPFKGRATGAIVSIVPTPEGLVFTVHASGNATQLGHYTRVEELLLNPATGSFTGTIDFTAANGDTLSVTLVGQFISATTAVGTYTIVGGAGRFAGATGGASFEAVTPDGVQVSVDFSGTISSVGS